MTIKILGSGCKNCEKLYQNVLDAIKSSGITAEVVKVTQFSEIASYGVMQTPALVIDEKVVSMGKILSEKEIMDYLTR